MSIPKEPRQLMINLMYLVLMALLALNVSAEIMNAFLSLDKGISGSNLIVDESNSQIVKSIARQAKAYKQYDKYLKRAEEAHVFSKELDGYINSIRDELFERAGGPDEENPARPKEYKDKDIATVFLVKEGKGDELQGKLAEMREKFLALIENEEDKEALASSLSLKKPIKPEGSEKTSWAAAAFEQMPVVAVLPMLTKFRNDVKTSETAILNYFLKKSKGENVVFDEYEVVVSADKGYVIRGEDYTGEVFLGAYSSTNNNVSVSIDGKRYPMRNGKADFKFTPNGIGTKTYNVKISIKNPLTKEVKTYTKKITYEVGERSVTVSADKMKVLYVGVDNPISVSAAGVKTSSLRVKAEGTPLTKKDNVHYVARPKKIGKAKIIVSGENLAPTTYEYKVKRIPDPSIQLGRSKGGMMSKAEFKTHKGPIPILENFDFDATCKIMGFELVRVPEKQSPQVAINRGGKYSGQAATLVQKANHGDTYYFNELKVKCPGDTAGRKMNGLIFKIK